jgi:hypothetical protein
LSTGGTSGLASTFILKIKELLDNLYFHNWSRSIVAANGCEKYVGESFVGVKRMISSYPDPSTRRIDSDAKVVIREDVEGPCKYSAKDMSLFAEKTFGTTASLEPADDSKLAGMVPAV